MKRILVVDDNADAADSLAKVLRIEGYETSAAYSGEQAIELARSFRPDVVLLDLAMPATDGFAVAPQLRGMPETKEATIIAVTGYGLPGDRARCESAGFNGHLLKPVECALLLPILQGKTKPSFCP